MPEQRTYQGHVYQRNSPTEPWQLAGPAQSAGPSVVFQAPPDPYKQAAEARAAEDQAIQRASSERADAAARRAELEWNATHNVDGTPKAKVVSEKPLPQWAAKPYEDQIGIYGGVNRGLNTFKDEYAGNALTGSAENTIQGMFSSFGSEGQRDWWAQFGSTDNVIRNDLFGAALTESEKAAYAATTVSPSMDPKEVRRNLQSRRDILESALRRRTNFLKAQGYSKEAIEALAGEYADRLGAAIVAPTNPPAPEGDKGTLVPGDVANKITESGLTPEQQAAYDAFNAANPRATADQLRAFTQSLGIPLENADEIVKARDQGGGVMPAASGIVRPPNISDLRGQGGIAEGADAFMRGAADTLSLGFADEIGAAGRTVFGSGTMDENLRRERAIDRYDAENSPWLRGAGQLAGGLAFPIGRGAKTVGELAGVGGATGAGYGFGSGETLGDRFIGAGTGGVAGAALGATFGKLGDMIRARRGPPPPNGGDGVAAARDVAEASADLGIDMLPADVGGPTTRRLTSGVVQTPFGAKPIIEGAKRAAEQGRAARDAAASRYVAPSADGYGAGQAAKRGLTSWIKKSDTRATRLYDRISVEPETEAVTSSTTKALSEITEGMKSNRELSRIWTGHPRLRDTLDALTPTDTRQAGQVRLTMETERVRGAANDLMSAQNALSEIKRAEILPGNPRANDISAAEARVDEARIALSKARKAQDEAYVEANQPPMGGKLSWEDMKRLRSIIGEIVGSPGLGTEGNETAAMRKVYAALSDDMRATAEKQGPAALREFERANSYFRARESRIKNVLAPVMGKDMDKGGQAAFNQIQNWAATKGETAKLAQMMRSLPDDEADIVSATIISRLGSSSAGRQNAANDAFSFSEFLTHWNQLDNRAKAALFKPAQRDALQKLAKVADGTKEAQKYANYSNSAGGINVNATTGGLATAATLAITGYPILALAAASPAIGQYVTGRMMASPKFVNWLLRTPKEGPRLTSHIKKLGSMSVKSPLLSSELSQLEQALLKVANDNGVSRAAASPERKNEQDQ